MKKYLVIGNPIDHSLSPKLHNFWIKNNKLDAVYEKKKLNENELADLIFEIKKKRYKVSMLQFLLKKPLYLIWMV